MESLRSDSMLPDDAQRQLSAWSFGKKVIVELGSAPGRSSETILASSKGLLFMVDNHPRRSQLKLRLEERLKSYFDEGRCFLIDGSSIEAFTILQKLLAHRYADMVFIDSDPSPNELEMDIFNFAWLLSSGGLICGRYEESIRMCDVLERVLPDWKLENGLWYKVMA